MCIKYAPKIGAFFCWERKYPPKLKPVKAGKFGGCRDPQERRMLRADSLLALHSDVGVVDERRGHRQLVGTTAGDGVRWVEPGHLEGQHGELRMAAHQLALRDAVAVDGLLIAGVIRVVQREADEDRSVDAVIPDHDPDARLDGVERQGRLGDVVRVRHSVSWFLLWVGKNEQKPL